MVPRLNHNHDKTFHFLYCDNFLDMIYSENNFPGFTKFCELDKNRENKFPLCWPQGIIHLHIIFNQHIYMVNKQDFLQVIQGSGIGKMEDKRVPNRYLIQLNGSRVELVS